VRGEAKSTINEKGRMNFPAKFQETFGNNFVVAKGLRARCVQIYKTEEWEEFVKNLKENHPKTKADAVLRFRGAENAELDNNNRFFIPSHLREYAELKKDVVVCGLEGEVEIWNREALVENQNADISALVDEMGL